MGETCKVFLAGALILLMTLTSGASETVSEDDPGEQITTGRGWPGGVVPLVFDKNVELWTEDETSSFQSALEYIQEYSCVTFKLVTEPDSAYAYIHDGYSGCSSAFGYMGNGKHEISLPKGCRTTDVMSRELLHVLGIPNEDDTIDDDGEGEDQRTVDRYGISYDPVSLMNGGSFVSFKDLYFINQMYTCSSGCPLTACPPGAFTGQDCECWCDSGLRKWPVRPCNAANLPVSSESQTVNGNSDGAPCVFPFTYNGQPHYQCTHIYHSTYWCGTTANFDNDQKWGECQDVQISNDNSPYYDSSCQFPFTYHGVNYTSCTTRTRFDLWCSTTSDYDRDGQGTECVKTTVTEGGEAPDGSTCTFPFTYNGEQYDDCIWGYKGPWCCTESECDDNSNWGYCVEDGGTAADPEGPSCVFPFSSRGKSYTKCATHSRDVYWCSTTDDFDKDGLLGECPDENECKNGFNGGCEHDCFNTVNGYQCSCRTGYKLNKDGKTCDPVRTFGGTSHLTGAKCEFPFTYEGRSYMQCKTPATLIGDYSANVESLCVLDQVTGEWAECIEGECLDDDYGGCEHICRDWHGVKACSCYPGYELSGDGKSCKQVAYTEDGTAKGKPCKFPFKDEKGMEYTMCKYSESERRYWCPVVAKYTEGEPYGYCPETFRFP